MKKVAKLIALCLLSAALLSVGAFGCAKYKFNPLPGGPAATDLIEGQNGGSVVKKGDYLFVVNGKYDASQANDFGVPTKGDLYRIKLAEDGSVEETLQLSPKQVYAAKKDSGLFLSGDRIYYTSPSVEKDATGTIFSSYLDLFSVKLDGSDTKKLGFLTSNTFVSKWVEANGAVYFVYVDTSDASNTKIQAVDADGKTRTLQEKVVGTPVIGEDGYVYYTTDFPKQDEENLEKPEDEQEKESYYEVSRVSVATGEAEMLINRENAIVAPPTGFEKGYAVTLTHVEDGVLYYTKAVRGVTSLYAYDLTGKRAEADREVLVSVNNPTAVYAYLGFDETREHYQGIIASYSSKVSLITPDNVQNPVNLFGNNEVPATVIGIEGDYIYYTTSSAVQRLKIKENGAFDELHLEPEKLVEAAVDTASVEPKLVGEYLYLVPTTTAHPVYANYLYRWNVNHTSEDEHEVDGEMVKYELELIGKLTEADKKLFDEAEEDK